jgi:hypothetical protein
MLHAKPLSLLGKHPVTLKIAVCPNVRQQVKRVARLLECPPRSVKATGAPARISADQAHPFIGGHCLCQRTRVCQR